MIQKGIVLVLALGATAKVPHWMTSVQSPQSPSFESIMAPYRKLREQQSPRRLQAIMSDECKAVCPGAQDFVMKMMEAMSAETTPPPEGMDPMLGMMLSMCDQADTIVCIGTEKACMDEEPKEGDDPAAIKCLCECPDMMTAAMKMGEGDFAPLCDDTSKTLDCVAGKAECSSITKEMDPKQTSIICKMHKAGCMDKMTSCKTQGEAWETKCEKELTEGDAAFEAAKADCCPLGKDMMDCNGVECTKMSMAMMALDDKAAEETAKMDRLRTTCPDAGIPTKAEVEAAASSASSSDGGTAAGDETDGATGPAMAAVTAAMIALVA